MTDLKKYQMTCVEKIAHKILTRFKGPDLEVAREVVQIVLDENLVAYRKSNRKKVDDASLDRRAGH